MEVHGTVYYETQRPPEVPAFVKNHGLLPQHELQQLLRKAKARARGRRSARARAGGHFSRVEGALVVPRPFSLFIPKDIPLNDPRTSSNLPLHPLLARPGTNDPALSPPICMSSFCALFYHIHTSPLCLLPVSSTLLTSTLSRLSLLLSRPFPIDLLPPPRS